MASLMRSKNTRDIITNISSNIENSKLALASDVSDWAKNYHTTQLIREQAKLDSFIVGNILKDPALKIDAVQAVKKAGDTSTVAYDLVAGISENTVDINKYIKEFWGWTSITKTEIEDWLRNLIVNEQEYLNTFSFYTQSGKDYNKALKEIDEVWAEADYYIAYSNFFDPRKWFDVKKVVAGIKGNFATELDKSGKYIKTLTKTITWVTSLRQLENVVKYNVWALQSSDILQDVFKEKFTQLKIKSSTGEGKVISESNVRKIEAILSVGKEIIKWEEVVDKFFFKRLAAAGYNGFSKTIDSDLYKILRDQEGTITYGDKVFTVDDSVEIIWLLWPSKILELTRRFDDKVSGVVWASKITSDDIGIGMALVPDYKKQELFLSIIWWDKESFNAVVNQYRWTKRTYQDTALNIISAYHKGKHDLSEWFVFFDWNKERFSKASKETRQAKIEWYENKHDNYAIETVDVDYIDTLEKLKAALKDNKKSVIVSDLQLMTRWPFVDEFKWRIIVSDVAGQNFSYGVTWKWTKRKLTIRGRNQAAIDEVGDLMLDLWLEARAVDSNKKVLESIENLKWSNLANANFSEADMAIKWNEIENTSKEDLTRQALEELKTQWYSDIKVDLNNIDVTELRDRMHAYLNVAWGETPEDLIKLKLQAFENLKTLLWVTPSTRSLSHYSVVQFLSSLGDTWFKSPLVWVKDFLYKYIETWQVDELFVANFWKTNNITKWEALKHIEERLFGIRQSLSGWAWVNKTKNIFIDDFNNLKATNKNARAVDTPTKKEISEAANNWRLIVNKDWWRGLVTKDGDIKYIFKAWDNAAVVDWILLEAVKMGGIKLDKFDGPLTKMYTRNGFRVVSRMEYNPAFAPDGIPQSVSKSKPDIVFMVHDPKNKLNINVKNFTKNDLEWAVVYRDSFIDDWKQIDLLNIQTRKNANPQVQASIDTYLRDNDLPEQTKSHYIGINIDQAKAQADAYDALPIFDNSPEVIKAYKALELEVNKQFNYMTEDLWVKIERTWFDEDAYTWPNPSKQMMDDVRDNNRLKVYQWWEKHPLLWEVDENWISANDRFRAIHDYFWHSAWGYGFWPRWEENAWLKHSQMFSKDAQPAMTTETRGQNSWVNYNKSLRNPNGSIKKKWDDWYVAPADRPFAIQKVALLPKEYSDVSGILWKNTVASQPITSWQTSDLVKPIKEWIHPTLENWPSQYINEVRESVSDLPWWAAIDVDLSSFDKLFTKALKEYSTLTKNELAKEVPNINTLESLQNSFYIKLDELEYTLDNAVGSIFKPQERATALYGTKFQNIPIRGKWDLAIFEDSLDWLTRSWTRKIEWIRDQRKLLNEVDWYEKTWIKVVDNNWRKVIVSVVDEIAQELKHIPANSKHAPIKRISRDSIEWLSTSDAFELLGKIKQANTATVRVWWFVKQVFENTSLYLRNISIRGLDEYKVINTRYWRMPKWLAESSFKWIDESLDAQMKIDIWESISKRYYNWDYSFDVATNRKDIANKIDQFVESTIARKIADTTDKAEISKLWSGREAMKSFYQDLFEPYAHFSPISKDSVNQLQEIYKITDDELETGLDNYLYRDDATDIWGTFANDIDSLVSDEVRWLYKQAEEESLALVEKEIGAMRKIPDAIKEYEKTFFEFYGRDVAARNERTQTIAAAMESTATKGKVAADELDRIIWTEKELWDLIIDSDAVMSVNGKVLPSIRIKREPIIEAQKIIEDLMFMSDEAFAASKLKNIEEWLWGHVAYILADYFREVRIALWTDWLWAWPTTSKQANIAMHEMRRAFKDVSWDTDWKIYQSLRWFISWLDSADLLRPMNSKSVKNIAGDEWLMDLSRNKSLVWDEELSLLTKNEWDIREAHEQFNKLFGSDLSRPEFLALYQSFSWWKRVNGLNLWLQKSFAILKSLPFASIIKKIKEFGANALTSSIGWAWYVGMVGWLRNKYTSWWLDFASRFRMLIWEWSETADLSDITNAFKAKSDVEWLIPYTPKNNDDLVNSMFNKSNKNHGAEMIWRGEKAWYFVNLAETVNKALRDWVFKAWSKKAIEVWEGIIESATRWRFGRTMELATQNGNNLLDLVFMGQIKDMGMLEWILHNSYRPFYSTDEFAARMKTASPDEINKVILSIKWTANRRSNDVMGVSFGALNQPVNAYSGIAGTALESLFFMRDTISYLTWRWRSKTRSAFRALNQMGNLVYRNWGILSKEWYEGAQQFIKNSPEFRAYIWLLKTDFINALRFHRLNTEDDEYTLKWIYDAITVVSAWAQAASVVTEFRPIIWWVEAYLNDDDVVAKMNLELRKILFQSLNIQKATLQLAKSISDPNVWLNAAVEEFFSRAWSWTLRYIAGIQEYGGRIYIPGNIPGNVDQSISGYTDDLTEISYWGRDITKAEVRKQMWSVQKVLTTSPVLNQIFWWIGDIRSNLEERINGEWVRANKQQEVDDAVMLSESWQEVIKTWTIKLKNDSDVSDYERSMMRNNPYDTSQSLKNVYQGILDFQELGSVWRGRLSLAEMALDSLYSRIPEDELTQVYDAMVLREDQIDKKQYTWKNKSAQKKKDKSDYIKWVNDKLLDIYWAGEHAQTWIALKSIWEDMEWVKLDTTLDKIKFYNWYMDKHTQMLPLGNDNYVASVIARRHGNEINEQVWGEYFTIDETQSNPYWKMEYKTSEAFSQMVELSEAAKAGNMDRVRAVLNPATIKIFAKSDDSAWVLAAAIWTTYMLREIDWSPSLSLGEKFESKYHLLENSVDVLVQSKEELNKLGLWWTELLTELFNRMINTEDELSDWLISQTDDFLKSWKPSDWEWSGSWGDWSSINLDDVKAFKQKLSKWLDLVREEYRAKPLKTDPAKFLNKTSNEAKKKFPLKVSANTKAPSWFTKAQLSLRKDIKRRIKIPKRKKITPPLV